MDDQDWFTQHAPAADASTTPDATAAPVTFAVVNGQRVPVDAPPAVSGADWFAQHAPDAPPPAAPARTWADRAVEALPMLGGAAGGIIGGMAGAAGTLPIAGVGGVGGAVGGAMLGGAGGKSLENFLEDLLARYRGQPTAPRTITDTALGLANEAGKQGLGEVGGQALMAGGNLAAHGLMNFAIRPAPSLAREFPNIAETALAERLPVGSLLPGGQAGSDMAAKKLVGSSRALRALLARADAAGTTFTNNDVAAPVLELIDEISKQPLGDAQMQQLSGMINEFLRRHPGPLTPTAVKELKQAAQAIARPIYKAEAAGQFVPAAESLAARFNQKVATGARESLESISPAVRAQEQKTQGLIGVTAAIANAERRRLPLTAEAASAVAGTVGAALRGHGYELAADTPTDVVRGIASWLATRSLLSPKVTSRMALGLSSRQVQQMLRQVPRLAEYVVRTERPEPGSPAPK